MPGQPKGRHGGLPLRFICYIRKKNRMMWGQHPVVALCMHNGQARGLPLRFVQQFRLNAQQILRRVHLN